MMRQPRRMRLADSGCCQGHLCDLCAVCQLGRCCRKDDPHYSLPAEGTWGSVIYGQIGVLDVDADTVRCHACGKWYRSVALHAWLAHNLTADEYRAVFGLKFRTALVAESVSAALSIVGKRTAERDRDRLDRNLARGRARTPEQISFSLQKKRRTESRLNPAWQEHQSKALVACWVSIKKLRIEGRMPRPGNAQLLTPAARAKANATRKLNPYTNTKISASLRKYFAIHGAHKKGPITELTRERMRAAALRRGPPVAALEALKQKLSGMTKEQKRELMRAAHDRLAQIRTGR